MSDLIVISPCFYPNSFPADLMVKSAVAHELRVEIYGVNEPFIPHGADAQVVKLYELMKHRGKLAEHVLVTDCRDVLFQAGEAEILTKFESFKSLLVMSSENGCWPPDPAITSYFHGKDPNGYNYVNAGQYIGTWDYVLFCLEVLLDKYQGKHPGADNSQGWWMWAKMRDELDFVLDSKCDIFQTMSGGSGDQVHVQGRRAFNMSTLSWPCSLHFNGNPGNSQPQEDMYRRLFA